MSLIPRVQIWPLRNYEYEASDALVESARAETPGRRISTDRNTGEATHTVLRIQ